MCDTHGHRTCAPPNYETHARHKRVCPAPASSGASHECLALGQKHPTPPTICAAQARPSLCDTRAAILVLHMCCQPCAARARPVLRDTCGLVARHMRDQIVQHMRGPHCDTHARPLCAAHVRPPCAARVRPSSCDTCATSLCATCVAVLVRPTSGGPCATHVRPSLCGTCAALIARHMRGRHRAAHVRHR